MRSIRNIGLAAVAALALLGFPAAALATGGVEADSYPATYRSVETKHPVFGVPGLYTTCNESSIWGEASGPSSTLGSLEGMKCGNNNEKLAMNGCKFEFHPGSSKSFDIGPPGCGPINGPWIGGLCYPSIVPQTGVPATYTAVTVGGVEKIDISVSTELKHTMKGCGGGDPGLYFEGAWRISGFNVAGEPTSIRMRTGFDGFFIGSGSGVPKFEAESYPAQLSGGLDPKSSFTFTTVNSAASVTCGEAQLTAKPTGASTALGVGGTYGTCVGSSGSAAIAMNSCSFNYSLNAGSPPYVGGVGVACGTEGDSISITFPNCVVTIPAQSPQGSIAYENQGSGDTRAVHTAATATGLTYTYKEKLCTLLGKNHTDGALSASFTLQGP